VNDDGPTDGKREETMEVLFDELEEEGAPQRPREETGQSLAGLLDDLEAEVRATPSEPALGASLPPPLPPSTPPVSAPPVSAPPPLPDAPSAPPSPDAVAADLPTAEAEEGDRPDAPPEDGGPSGAEIALAGFEEDLLAAEEPAIRARLHFELGRLRESPLRDLEAARHHYETCLDGLPDHLPAIRGLRRVLLALKDPRGALPLYDAELRLTRDGRAKAGLLYGKGRLLEDHLGDPQHARQAYQQAAQLDAANVSILRALEQRDRLGRDRDALDRTLERVANAVVADPPLRASLVTERARLWASRDGGMDRAIELYETALGLDPDATAPLAALEGLHRQQGRWRDLVRILRHRAERSDATTRAALRWEIARLQRERLGKRDDAIRTLEEARAESPTDRLVLEDLAALYEREQRPGDQADVLAALVEEAEGAEAVALYHRMGALLRQADRDEAARDAFERALARDPTHGPSLRELGELHEAAGAHAALAEVLRTQAEALRDPLRRAVAHGRLGEHLERRLDDPEGAIEQHTRALALDPRHAPSFKQLVRLYAEAARWRELVDLHARQVEHASSKEEAIAHLFEMGRLYEEALREPAQAAAAYRAILERAPKDLGAVQALQRATERAGRYGELVDALEAEAALRVEAERAPLLARAAEVLDVHLDDPPRAVAAYQRVLASAPKHAAALEGLGRLLHRLGRWEELLELLRVELATLPDAARAAHLAKMGELCEARLGDDDRAVALYREALQQDPTYGPARSRLIARLETRRDHDGVADALDAELSHRTEPATRARLAYRLGVISESHLGDPRRALAAYETALEAQPGSRPVEEARARLLAAEGAHRRRVADLERQAREGDEEHRRGAWSAAGELWEHTLGDPRKAADAHERALDDDPAHLPSLLALERLYRRLSRFDDLARVYATLARTLTDRPSRVAALRELARVQERIDARVVDRRTTQEAILMLAPGDPEALAELEALALSQDDRTLLARIDATWIEGTTDPRLAAAHRVRLAETLEAKEDPAALDAFRAAVQADPESLAAVRGLARTARRQGDSEARVDACRREAALLADDARAAGCWVEAGRVLRTELGRATEAAEAFERALELAPEDAEAASALRDALTSVGQAAAAADRLCRAAARVEGPRRRALYRDVAELRAHDLEDRPGALEALARILDEVPQDIPTLRRAAELQQEERRHADAAGSWAAILEAAEEPADLLRAHLALAELRAGPLDDVGGALASLDAALRLDPGSDVALRRRADLAQRRGDLDAAAADLERWIENARDATERTTARLKLARLEDSRGDREAARRLAAAAVAEAGPGSEAAALHRDLVGSPSEWEAHARALEAWLARTVGTDAQVQEAHLERARILRQELGRPRAAAEALEAALELAPADIEIARTLAVTLRLAGEPEQSAGRLRSLLRRAPSSVALWHELGVSLDASGAEGPARRARAPIVALGQASAAEAEAYRERRRPSLDGRLEPAALEALFPVHQARTAVELLRVLRPALPKIYGPELSALGLSTRDKLKDGTPLRLLGDRLAALLSTGPYHLYLHRVRSQGLTVELTDPPSLILPAALAEMPEPAQVFALAQPMAAVALGLHPVHKLTPREVEIVLAAAARRYLPRFGRGLTNDEALDDLTKRLHRHVPRRQRKALDELAKAYVEAPLKDYGAFVEGVRISSLRVALLLADDLQAALDVLRRTERDLAELSPTALLERPLVASLIRFYAGPEADAVRQAIG
jgi:tetratricopeptide (TPR) repeat protein